MGSLGTQVLFVPYRGGKNAKRSNGEISQQKHAAREYHRKAKLIRQSQRSKRRSTDATRADSTSSEKAIFAPNEGSSSSVASRSTASPAPANGTPPSTRRSSPVSVLGAGRIDPFNSQPVKDLTPCVHEMVDYALVYQWPIFKFVNPNLAYQDMKVQVAHRLRLSQTSFYCTIFAAATHYALSRVGQEAPTTNLMLRLDYKDRCLKMMMGDVGALGQNMPDEMLHAIFALASYGSAERIGPMHSRDMKNPLATGFDLDVYSRIPAENAHVRALSHLLKERGGLRTIKRPGFAAVVSLYDVFTSFRVLKSPDFPLLHPTSDFVSIFSMEPDRVSRMCLPLQRLLPHLPSSSPFAKLKSTLEDVITVTLAYEQYEFFEPSAASLNAILMARHCVLHDLLTIGDAGACNRTMPPPNWLPSEDILYNLTWLSSLSYMALDLHPCTRGPGPHELLAVRLNDVISRAREHDLHLRQPVLYQWAVDLQSRLTLPST